MNKGFNQAWKFFAGGATVLAYGEWIERIKSPQMNLEHKKEIHSHISAVQNQISKMEDQLYLNLDEETRKNIMQKVKELTQDLNNIRSALPQGSNYFSKFEEGTVSTDSESSLNLYIKYKEQIDSTFKNASSKANEIADIINNSKGKKFTPSLGGEDDNFILNLITEYKEYLSSLTVYEICLILNITTCVFIFTCFITILLSLSGNLLINKFSLEQRFPKFSKIIQIRIKFQNYYIFINSILILVALISLLFVNIITFISG